MTLPHMEEEEEKKKKVPSIYELTDFEASDVIRVLVSPPGSNSLTLPQMIDPIPTTTHQRTFLLLIRTVEENQHLAN